MSEQLHATMLLNHTKRREHIPEPVEDEHDGRAKSSASRGGRGVVVVHECVGGEVMTVL